MSQAPIKVAVVGHTNTGKTSLLRTLARDVSFGEVSSRPGTTRHVEATQLLAGGKPVIDLFDTPGLEDSATLLEILDADRTGDGIERIERFLKSGAAHGELQQEAKVLRQVLASDLLLYIIDAREPFLGRHRDELTILAYAARPVIPVLNFVASADAREGIWRQQLGRLNFHAVVAFDTVLYDPLGERRLFEKMQTVLDAHYTTLQSIIDERGREREALRRSAALAIADLLIDAAAACARVDADDQAALVRGVEQLREWVRQREQSAVAALLAMFKFRAEDCEAQGLPIAHGRWQMDLFGADTMKRFGLVASKGAATGAAVGFGIDVITGGLSLGAAATIGATIGALLGTLNRFGRRLIDRVRGVSELRVDNVTLRLLAAREWFLANALLHRGHAAQERIRIGEQVSAAPWHDGPLPKSIEQARLNPDWSRMGTDPKTGFREHSARQEAVHALQRALLQYLK